MNMKPSEFLSGIIYFFNDLIGSVVPGLIMLAGLYVLKIFPPHLTAEFSKLEQGIEWTITIVIAYVLGHGLLSLHLLLQPYLCPVFNSINTLIKKKEWTELGAWKKRTDYIKQKVPYQEFERIVNERAEGETQNYDFNSLRNMAMTISNEAGELARRFMFISLLCYGVSMSILAISLITLMSDICTMRFVPAFFLFFIFYTKGIDFEIRAQNVPFPIALAEIISDKVKSRKEDE